MIYQLHRALEKPLVMLSKAISYHAQNFSVMYINHLVKILSRNYTDTRHLKRLFGGHLSARMGEKEAAEFVAEHTKCFWFESHRCQHFFSCPQDYVLRQASPLLDSVVQRLKT